MEKDTNYSEIKHYEMFLTFVRNFRKEADDFKKSVKEYAEAPIPKGVGRGCEREAKKDAELMVKALQEIDRDYMTDRSQSNSDNQHRIDMENWGNPW